MAKSSSSEGRIPKIHGKYDWFSSKYAGETSEYYQKAWPLGQGNTWRGYWYHLVIRTTPELSWQICRCHRGCWGWCRFLCGWLTIQHGVMFSRNWKWWVNYCVFDGFDNILQCSNILIWNAIVVIVFIILLLIFWTCLLVNFMGFHYKIASKVLLIEIRSKSLMMFH